MKLYATTTSERASKGQGGNDFIEIRVQDQFQCEILALKIEYVNNNPIVTDYYAGDINTGIIQEYENRTNKKEETALQDEYNQVKGEKQKGDTCDMENCTREATEGKYCHSCAKTV